MSFSASCPVALVEAANEALELAGWGPDNFAVPLRPNGASQGQGGTHAAFSHLADDAAFQAAVTAIPGVTVTTGAQLVRNFTTHVAAQALEWTDPTNWFLAPVMIGDQRTSGGKVWESLVDFNTYEPPFKWRLKIEVTFNGDPATFEGLPITFTEG